MDQFLFVYGTLRRASTHPMARYLADNADFVGEGTVAGKIHDLGRYPGLVEATSPEQRVAGEVFRLRHADDTFPRLDEYECCPTLYERRLTDITMCDQLQRKAWVYF